MMGQHHRLHQQQELTTPLNNNNNSNSVLDDTLSGLQEVSDLLAASLNEIRSSQSKPPPPPQRSSSSRHASPAASQLACGYGAEKIIHVQRFRVRHGLSFVIGPVWQVGAGCYSQAALPMPLSKPL